jgi:hypothetical protein
MAGPRADLNRLVRIAQRFGDGYAGEKADLVARLTKRSLHRATDVARFHETLLFLRAYPDDASLLAAVDEALDDFEERADLRRFAERLADSGIAGTPIHFPFHWVTAHWLVTNWPDAVHIDWEGVEDTPGLHRIVHLLVPYAEMQDLDALRLTPRAWIERLAGPEETDAAFIIRRFEALEADPWVREALFELFGASLRLEPTEGTPSRTHARLRSSRVVYQGKAPSRQRPDLGEAMTVSPRSIRSVSGRRARQLIHIAREAMVTRARDLDGIIYSSQDDVRLIDAGDGLSLVCIGLVPEYRALVETIYVFILLKNGVPVGYYQAALLFGSAEVNFNIFAPYRGIEAASIYARCLAVVHHMFDVDTFSVEPYQLGLDNEEALQSGAFWFYSKLGFCSEEPSVKRLVAAELAKMADDPRHRSSEKTLLALAQGHLFFHLNRPREDVVGKVPLGRIGLAISDLVSERFGADRERALAACTKEVRRLLSLRSLRGWTPDERTILERWSPLVLALGGIQRWPREDRRALVNVIRAKAGRREEDYAALLTEHTRLRKALLRLAAETP